MTSHRIAVIPGDGIGPEVMNEAVKVLELLQKLDSSLKIEFDTFDWSSEYYLKHGRMMPEDALDTLKNSMRFCSERLAINGCLMM